MSSKPATKPKVSAKTLDLAAEAADMETKLSELRRAMERERAKREKAGDGPIWRNGATGLLRTKFRTQTGPMPPGAPSADSSRATSSQSPHKPSLSQLSPPLQEASTSQFSGSRLYPIAGSAPAVRSPWPSGSPAKAADMTPFVQPQPIIQPGSRQPDMLRVHPSSGQSSPGGMACGAEESDNLMSGQFNEADSHKSFLDALNEWRSANKPACPSTTAQQPSQAHGAAHAAAAMEVQTEGAGPSRSRPDSGKQRSYFDRLVLNAQARQAGQAATTGQTGPNTGGAGMLPRIEQSSSMTRPSVQVYSLDTALTASLPPLSPGSSARTTSLQQGSGTPSRHKGLDILEELEALELQRHKADAYDSDEEFVRHGFGQHGSAQQAEALVITTQAAGVGLTKGVRLPDAILLPQEEVERDD